MREQRLKYNGNALRELKKRIGLIKSGAGFTLVEILVSIVVLIVVGSSGGAEIDGVVKCVSQFELNLRN